MLRELIAKDIYVFTSELYAQVTASAILTPAGAIVIDTLPFPVETREIINFIERRHGLAVRYLINTHYHADHTYGASLFDAAQVVSHRLTRDLLDGPGRAGLEAVQETSRELASVRIRLPDLLFDGEPLPLELGGVRLTLSHAPGHSPDCITCYIEDEAILFAGDAVMPLPFFADGSWQDTVDTLETLRPQRFEAIVQGHGEVILRGEVQERIEEDLYYLRTLRERVEQIVEQGDGPDALRKIALESCGKSPIALNGIVQQLHATNAEALYWALIDGRASGGEG